MPGERDVERPVSMEAAAPDEPTAQTATESAPAARVAPRVPPPAPESSSALPEAGLAAPAAPGPAASAERAMPAAELDTDLSVPSPQQWAERIESLHDSGDLDRAAEELRAFRLAWPDADDRLSPDLQPWAASVR
jgi:hypothetical protein